MSNDEFDYDRPTPIEAYENTRRWWWRLVWFLLIALLLIWFFSKEWVIAYDDEVEHFKYGSIGSEGNQGLPTPILQALPVIYKDELGDQGFAKFGLIQEEGHDLPIGFSKRIVGGIERAWLNCSVCHYGTYTLPGETTVHTLPGGASNDLDLFAFIEFFTRVGKDPGFNTNTVIAAINSDEVPGNLNFLERQLYRFAVMPLVKKEMLALSNQLEFVARQEPYGPGRVDTFNSYKVLQFGFPMGPHDISDVALNGSSDYPSIWMQRPRAGMNLHWDGNNASVTERNFSAALGAGVSPVTVDAESLFRIRDWIDTLEAPKFPGEINMALAETGAPLFETHCAACHGMGNADYDEQLAAYEVAMAAKETGEDHAAEALIKPTRYDYDTGKYPYLGQVVGLEEIGTDVGRWASYDQDFAAAQMGLYAGTPYRFRHFKKTDGYANHPLDGIWARSPYLHNGSVPTLRDLMNTAAERPKTWLRGARELDLVKVGYRSDARSGGTFTYDTNVLGNGNAGHEYGTSLSDAEKDAIVEYMKTL
ncbi:hypothetical protein AIOL_003801 [Candidatus Rhodobacter oscarellae]|uniref:Cytochrome c domain-containing protein n=1 Tax=Candidatus Rhodobacter oscarellae TaxID=1675527 RepID=A0A0J9E7W3_9RHOB|nr:di-heme-cytochrome C peroxidase [Candidatus Rhodobacter lobularis]KMW58821.1 hypothetical protein AIOL_003801 [Candidatus Rhodobacter lobularis]